MPGAPVYHPRGVTGLRGTCRTLVVDLAPLTVAPLVQALTLVPVVLTPLAAPKAERLLQRTLCTMTHLQEDADRWERRAASRECGPCHRKPRRVDPLSMSERWYFLNRSSAESSVPVVSPLRLSCGEAEAAGEAMACFLPS